MNTSMCTMHTYTSSQTFYTPYTFMHTDGLLHNSPNVSSEGWRRGGLHAFLQHFLSINKTVNKQVDSISPDT